MGNSSSIKKHITKLATPLASGLLAGAYPALYYCYKNYALVNSTEHLVFFTSYFFVLPSLISILVFLFFKKYSLHTNAFFSFAFFGGAINFLFFSGKLQLLLYTIVLLAALIYGIFFKRHHLKFMFAQGVMAIVACLNLINIAFTNHNISSEWKIQADSILDVQFKHRPNIYVLQPDGYVNFSEYVKGYYSFGNNDFKNYLSKKGFTNYDGFRSNYASTLSSNSSLFMMKHHQYFNIPSYSDVIDYRKHIITDNTVLSIFKNNGYQTHFIAENPYLLANYPESGFDTINFSFSDFGPLYKWNKPRIEVESYFDDKSFEANSVPQFYFVQFFNPSHISTYKKNSLGMSKEKLLWKQRLIKAENTLKILVNSILSQDPTALIIILSDHGGYVGLDYTMQAKNKTEDRDLIYSMFSSQLSILWPEELKPETNLNIKSSVNIFRFLFSQLSEQMDLLNYLEPDESYIILNNNKNKGVYLYIDDSGGVSFRK